MTAIPLIPLCALLAASVWHDVRARRIPNAVVFPGMLAALALHALLPAALGGLGIVSALGGLALGLAILMPMYALRLMGAGDVKLLAMVGAFVGAGQVPAVALATLLAGGVLALLVAAWQGSLRRLLGNTRQMMVHGGMSALAGFMTPAVAPAAPASGRLPYAVAIAAGTGACLLWLHMFGEWPL
nr:A24 family peptidase [uncultured Massilia sp.]